MGLKPGRAWAGAGVEQARKPGLPHTPAAATMWPFISRALFPPPTEAWLQRASSDPEAQGWGAWSPAEKTRLGPGAGGEEEETGEAEEEDEEDAGFLLSLLEREGLAEYPVPDQELEAIKLKLWTMEQAQGPEPPRVQDLDEGEEAAGALLARQLLSPQTDSPLEKAEADHRSVYVGNLCLHRVCHRELGPGCCGAGQEHLSRPGHQGAAQKDQFTRDQFHGPRRPSRTPRRQSGILPPQRPPRRGPFQTTRAEPGTRKILTMVFSILKQGLDFESGVCRWVRNQQRCS
ncbi:embryonic polyadenylate-binding protein 2 isoform X2 [Moschus berezovskii]|uniref:embryonic polyadenylate-binding protein 2 isoform X2 n=1 Tax=Moschus berezovskii TaxID=68408 RepID=UPI002444CA9A|nr:embryonic polyadenylate-binding protein 2 isoform X2 [Moschus berezovskii]